MKARDTRPVTTLEQSEQLLKMGLSPETADGVVPVHTGNGSMPVWSLARLVAIAFDQNGPDSVIHLYRHSDPFEDIIAFLDYQIEAGHIKPEYLKQ